MSPAVHDFISTSPKSTLILAGTAVVLVLAPLDITQLICALLGALVYASLQASQKLGTVRPARRGDPAKDSTTARTAAAATIATLAGGGTTGSLPAQQGHRQPPRRGRGGGANGAAAAGAAGAQRGTQAAGLGSRNTSVPGPLLRPMPSSAPIVPPSFRAAALDEQVEELLCQIMPNPEDDRLVHELGLVVKSTLQALLPEVEVVSFASGGLKGGTAYGVAVPEVDIVANISPIVIVERLRVRLPQGGGAALGRSQYIGKLDARKLQKSAIRACTDRLVSHGGFKFRRSAFRGQEPKVTLLAPSALIEASEQAIPIDFSVNSVVPLYNAALLTECGQLEPRAKSLILLVKRWAKDRGVCHAAKGHLPPYAWSLLVIYFLQVSGQHDAVLPPLEGFAASSGLAGHVGTDRPSGGDAKDGGGLPRLKSKWVPSPIVGEKKSVAELFKDFVSFYHTGVDWRNEAVSIRLGKRGPPGLSLEFHIIVRDDGNTEVAPTIEDPFHTSSNIASCMDAWSFDRLREELARAQDIFAQGGGSAGGGSLSELLEPWRPAEFAGDEEKSSQSGGSHTDRPDEAKEPSRE